MIRSGSRMLRAYIAVCLLSIVAACAPETKITTNKMPDYVGNPKRLFVFSRIEGDFGDEFTPTFNDMFVKIAKECGADAELVTTLPESSDNQDSMAKMKAFNPDTVLSITRGAGLATRPDMLTPSSVTVARTYNLQLIELPSQKTVWRANAVFRRGSGLVKGSDRGQTLAIEITDRMKSDGIFRSCLARKPA